jgi:small-conductance mechanosensitive channel
MFNNPRETPASIPDSPGDKLARGTERRIAWLTLAFGAAACVAAALGGSRMWAGGLLIGAILAWLNFRWLRRGMDALVAASAAQAGAKKPRVPLGAYFAAVFRYGLIALVVYVIFKVLQVPLASMVVGMCALAAAAIAASVYELWHSDGK